MAKTEREYVEGVRDSLRKAERELDKAIEGAMGVVRFNADAGKAFLSNEAFGVAGELTELKAIFMRTHKAATDVLFANWPDFADEVVTRGPDR